MGTRQRIFATLAAAVLAIAGAACASTTAATAAQTTEKTGKTCFNATDITSFVPLPGPYLYVRVLTSDHYLLTLNRDSAPLDRVWNIQVSPNFPRVC